MTGKLKRGSIYLTGGFKSEVKIKMAKKNSNCQFIEENDKWISQFIQVGVINKV